MKNLETGHGNRPVVLRVGPPSPWLDATLRESYDVVEQPRADVTVAVVTQLTEFGMDRFDALPALGLVANLGVGYDNVDLRAARERGVQVSNTPGVLNDAVAELTVGLVLGTLRNLPGADRYVRAGRWVAEGAFPLQRQLFGATVGILGLGRIGTAVAERLNPFGCHIAYHSRRPVPGTEHEYVDSPVALARLADVLIVTVPADATAGPIVDRPVLQALGPDGVLVNVARGSVVDEAALVEMLLDGSLGGAGLDVYRDEPLVPQELLQLDNVVLLPHVGSATTPTRRAMGELLLANVASFCADGSLVTPVPLDEVPRHPKLAQWPSHQPL